MKKTDISDEELNDINAFLREKLKEKLKEEEIKYGDKVSLQILRKKKIPKKKTTIYIDLFFDGSCFIPQNYEFSPSCIPLKWIGTEASGIKMKYLIFYHMS